MSTHLFTTSTPCPLYDHQIANPTQDDVYTFTDIVHEAANKFCADIHGAAAAIVDPHTVGTVYQVNQAFTPDAQRDIAASLFSAMRYVRKICAQYAAGFPAIWSQQERRTWIRARLSPISMMTRLSKAHTDHDDLAKYVLWICSPEYVDDYLPVIDNVYGAGADRKAADALTTLFTGWNIDNIGASAIEPDDTDSAAQPIVYVWRGAPEALLTSNAYEVVVIDPSMLCDIVADYLSSIDYNLRYDIDLTCDGTERPYWITGGLSTGDMPTDAMAYLDVANAFGVFE